MKLGIIGGSGLYNIDSLDVINTINVETPFGPPSDKIVFGKIDNTEIYFLPRHGSGHKIAPHEINHKANIFAMKKLGVTHILSISAVGSLKEKLIPKDIVFVDQYYDRTKQGTIHTFFGNGIVAHIPFSDPTCNEFRNFAYNISNNVIKNLYGENPNTSPKSVNGGTYVNMEGTAFSTKAESNVYRQLGFDIIGMTSLAEAKLSREAEICYCTAAMITDYDCWHPDHDNVSVDIVINTMKSNVHTAKSLITDIAKSFHLLERNCKCNDALKFSIMTDPKSIDNRLKKQLKPITGKYL
jgi:5'-methylthioadenosine phosphorylase